MIAAPLKQINHKYIDRSISQWLDIHFGDTAFNGRIFVGHRKHGGGVYTMTARSLSELRPYILMVHASQRLDYYVTANTVNGTSRTKDALFGLQNIVIDIDCHDKQMDSAGLVQAFLWRAERDLWSDADFPCPNSIVRTGRGVQLWWAIKPCHADCLYYYNQIKQGLMERIDAMLDEYEDELCGLQVDHGASKNVVGYFRLPCTYNTAAHRYGTLQVLHSVRYDTHELAGYIYPTQPEKRPTAPAKAIPMQKCDLVVLHNAYSTGANRVMQLIRLRNLRNNDVGAETRNNLNFAVYNSLRMSFDHDEAMERLRAYNEGFKEPMTEEELEHTICTAARKGGYKYTNEKLIELLDIKPAEQDAIGLHPFTGVYKPWSHAKPNASRDAVRKARKDDRDAKIISMHQEGIAQAETARTLGISRNTVAKVIREWIAQKDLEIAQENLLNIGAMNENCLLYSTNEVAVSIEEPPMGADLVLPAGGGSGRDGP